MRLLLLLVSCLVTLAGYWGPWVEHRAAVLVITGLDLGEYVKFLVPVREAQVAIWREGFYLPLVTVSVALSLWAFRDSARSGRAFVWFRRLLMLAVAVIAALNLLPPAWTPGLLLEDPQFQLQVVALVLCLGAVATSPLLALLPRIVPAALLVTLSLASLWWPVSGFLRVLPTIEGLYNEPLSPGWGMYVMIVGLILNFGLAISDFGLLGRWRSPNPKSEI